MPSLTPPSRVKKAWRSPVIALKGPMVSMKAILFRDHLGAKDEGAAVSLTRSEFTLRGAGVTGDHSGRDGEAGGNRAVGRCKRNGLEEAAHVGGRYQAIESCEQLAPLLGCGIACQSFAALLDPERFEEAGLFDRSMSLRAGFFGCGDERYEIHMGRQVRIAGTLQGIERAMLSQRLEAVADRFPIMAIIYDKGGPAKTSEASADFFRQGGAEGG